MKPHRIVTISILAAAIAMIALGVSADEDNTKESEDVQWLGKVEEGDTVVIDNPYGDVRLRFGGYKGVLEVVSVIQLLRHDGAYLEVRPTEVDDGTEIRVEWTMKPGLDLPIPLEDDRSRADLAVMVPLGVTLEVRTTAGLVEVHGVRCDTDIHTESGKVLIRKHQGAVSALTTSGSIEATLLKNATENAQTFQTRTGGIEVWVAPGAEHRAILTTSGSITTDFSIEIEHLTGKEPDKKGTATLGQGGPDILLSSLRGNVALRRLVELHDGTAKP